MDSARCPECGGSLTAGQAGTGVCPGCLLRLGLAAGGPAPSADVPHAVAAVVPDPESIGPYTILRRLGEGGMGVVYLADQAAPVRRRVALKVVKRGLGTRDVIRRFDAERQALALMDHPSIARVHDAGETPDGLPYFAMEYVDGEPITAHCDRHRLAMRERLELLVEVCSAVQHAHRKGVIHRDIKPSNVLVTTRADGGAVPKVIDFGVAKAVEHRATERSLFTDLGMIVGTPEYMSPEQAEFTGERVDTRTDVYSLGVLQYELITGALPFDPARLRAGGFDEICRRIREEEPSRPSVRVSGAGEAATQSARLRRVEVAALRRQLAGELDWITMKALEKDPARRYGSPQELADDLHRYLRHEPVLAGPPSAAYRLQKFVRRNRIAVAGAAAVLVVLVAGAITATTFAIREARQRRETERARQELERVAGFQQEMLSDLDAAKMGQRLLDRLQRRVREKQPDETRAGAAAAALAEALRGVNLTDAALDLLDEEILARALEELGEQFAGEPLTAARMQSAIATTYWRLGLHERAVPPFTAALETRRRLLGDDHPDTLGSMNNLANVYLNQGRYRDAEPLYVEALAGRRRVLGADHAETLKSIHHLAGVYGLQGRIDEAEPLYLEALEGQRRVLGDDHEDTLRTLNYLAAMYARQGRHAEAEPLAREALEAQKRLKGTDNKDTLLFMNTLGQVYWGQKRYDEAGALLSEAIEIHTRMFGADNPDTITMRINLATFRSKTGSHAQAEALYLEAIGASGRVMGDGHPYTLSAIGSLARLYADQARFDEAEPLYREVLEGRRRALGADHKDTLATMDRLARLLLNRRPGTGRDRESALRLALEAVEAAPSGNPDHLDTLALAYFRTGQVRQAVATLERALTLVSPEDTDRRGRLAASLEEYRAVLP